jgi:cell division protein FtsQ
LNWKKTIVNVLWLLLGVGTIVLFGAAMIKKNNKTCSDLKIEITGAEEHLFIDEKDVKELINKNADLSNKKIKEIDLKAIETELEKTAWVKNAELFFDNKQVLQVKIEERQPIARVFTMQGSSFYLDSAGVRLPLSDKVSARVPMFTSFPNSKVVMAPSDSLLLKGVVKMGNYITVDSFWRAQIEQVAITPQGTFELVPAIGDQTILFGNADNLEDKFLNLYTFYKKAWLQNGMNTYEKLDVRFKNQVVAVKKGTSVIADTSRANAAIKALMNGSLVVSSDSLSNVLIPKKDSVATKKAVVKENKKNILETKHVLNNKKRNNTFSLVKKSNAIVKKER